MSNSNYNSEFNSLVEEWLKTHNYCKKREACKDCSPEKYENTKVIFCLPYDCDGIPFPIIRYSEPVPYSPCTYSLLGKLAYEYYKPETYNKKPEDTILFCEMMSKKIDCLKDLIIE